LYLNNGKNQAKLLKYINKFYFINCVL